MLKRVMLLSAVGASLLWATNGDELMGIGAKSRAMGGVGIALDLGAENGLNNPAFIETGGRQEFLLGGTLFMPDVSYDGGDGYKKSDADLSVIPAAALAGRINERFSYGVGMFGTAGMGVDYRDDESESTMQMVTALQIMKFAVPLCYKFGNFRIGYTPYVQYSSLDINYKEPTLLGRHRGAGVAQDLGIGHIFGAGYVFDGKPVGGITLDGLKIGLVYKTSVDMDFKDQLQQATELFTLLGYLEDMGDTLEQPSQFGAGLSYAFGAHHTVAFDWKHINWSDAKGYKVLKWKDQDVFAIGYEYAEETWSLRAGYNYASMPFAEKDGTTAQGATINLFNLLGFPATVEQHFTFGGEYRVNEHLSFNGAFVYAPETTTTYDTSGINPEIPLLPHIINDTASVRHQQSSLTFTLNYSY
ncbi:OmpP1/FadL family transporter [Hydrogenimonas urashimensis]|uniref:OmpP1/FadL family transporter n=1 Tax=Hydrogenimonas urashimensis TaxID=2740515 RepID=UPI0019161DD5|nr:outer membrane protein transport protein [Hydrogenimonas urashimensis]